MIKDNLPLFLNKNKTLKNLFKAEDLELDLLNSSITRLLNELNPATTSELIARHEEEYALSLEPNLSLEQRRASILAKKRNKLIPTSEVIAGGVKELLNAIDVEVKDLGNARIKVIVESIGLIDNMDIAIDFVKEIRPAHVAFEFSNLVERSYNLDAYVGINVYEEKLFNMEVG